MNRTFARNALLLICNIAALLLFGGEQAEAANVLKGSGVLITYNTDATTSQVASITFNGYLSSNTYSLSTTYSNGVVQAAAHDGRCTYIVSSNVNSVVTNMLPAHMSELYYPLDAEIFTRCIVFFSDWYNHRSNLPTVTNDPWLDPRKSVAFEATTQRVRVSNNKEFKADYTVDPKIAKRLLKNPSESKYVALWEEPRTLAMWTRGYVEESEQFTNSTWTITSHDNASFSIEGIRLHGLSTKLMRGKVFERILIRVNLEETDERMETRINPTNLNLSVYDHRLQDRTRHIDGVIYQLNKHEWLSTNAPILLKDFETLKAKAPVKLRSLQRNPKSYVAVMFLCFLAFSAWCFSKANKRNLQIQR